MDYYICLDFASYIKNKKLTMYKNEFGDNPYIEKKKLYIPIEMLNDKYLKYYNVKPKSQQEPEEEEEEEEEEVEEEGQIKRNNIINLKQINPTGLYNIGGICYLNAVLQCFFHCKPLTEYFLNRDNLKYFKNEKLRPFSNSYYELVKGLCSGDCNAASKFKNVLIQTDDTFNGKEGKDSKDVAVLLLSEINDELQDENNENKNTNSNLDHSNLIKVYEEKKKIENSKKTIITSTFNFLIKYEQICKSTCPKYYRNYFSIESDNILIFELETIYNEIHRNNFNKTNPEISLEECLDYFKWRQEIECPYCKNNSYINRPTLKVRKAICSLPKIFIFVLSRGFNIQFDCKIIFNEDLDMGKYYESVEEERNTVNYTKYKLIGATFAYDWTKGYRHSGHTVAFCKSFKGNEENPQYYIFNDSKPRVSSLKELRNKVPYLLFYQQCK